MMPRVVGTHCRVASSHRKDQPVLQEGAHHQDTSSSVIPRKEAFLQEVIRLRRDSHNDLRVSDRPRGIHNSNPPGINLGRILRTRNRDSHNHAGNSRFRTNGVVPVPRVILRSRVVMVHKAATHLAKDSMDKASRADPQASKAKVLKAGNKVAQTITRLPLIHGITLGLDQNTEIVIRLALRQVTLRFRRFLDKRNLKACI